MPPQKFRTRTLLKEIISAKVSDFLAGLRWKPGTLAEWQGELQLRQSLLSNTSELESHIRDSSLCQSTATEKLFSNYLHKAVWIHILLSRAIHPDNHIFKYNE